MLRLKRLKMASYWLTWFVFEKGQVIEEYPEERRTLLYADTPTNGIPPHIVVEDTEAEGVIVTAYVPDPDIWIANVHRRRKR